MNATEKRMLRGRKPLADRTNTFASASSLSSSSSSKPPPLLSKPPKSSLPAPTKPPRNPLNPNASSAAAASENAQLARDSGRRPSTALRSRKIPPRSDDQTKIVGKRKVNEVTDSVPRELKHLLSTPRAPVALHNSGTNDCATRQAKEKRDKKADTSSVLLGINKGKTPLSSREEPDSLHKHGKTMENTQNKENAHSVLESNGDIPSTFVRHSELLHTNALMEDSRRQCMDRTKERGKAVLVPFVSTIIQDPSTSRDYEYIHNLADGQYQRAEQLNYRRMPNSIPLDPMDVTETSTSRPLPEPSYTLGTVEPLTTGNRAKASQNPREKKEPVIKCLKSIKAGDLSPSQQQSEPMHGYDAIRQMTKRLKQKGRITSLPQKSFRTEEPSTPQQNPEDRHNAGAEDSAINVKTVYTRRRRAKKYKNSDCAPSSCPPEKSEWFSNLGEESEGAAKNDAQSRSHTDPHRRPKKIKSVLPKDFIEKQRAYFAEVDAFELPEEVMSSSDTETTGKASGKHYNEVKVK